MTTRSALVVSIAARISLAGRPSYGEDRITAMVRDASSAYLYWEITDEGIASARSRLGAAGADGWCNLRIYDTTALAFDGTNANDYFDIRVERTDREYYLFIGRQPARPKEEPSATA